MAGCALLAVAGMSVKVPSKSKISDAQAIENAKKQMGLQIQAIEADKSGKVLNPVTTKRNRFSTGYCGYADWRSGFFPGSTWYLYELTGDKSLLPLAVKYTEAISQAKTLTWHHDIGFIINCSFGNGLRLADKPEYKDVMIEAAKSLCTRFREGVGVIQSWNVTGDSWQAKRGWECPVIIDNMMNLELLFEATKLSGDSTYYKVAVKHADNTLKIISVPTQAAITWLTMHLPTAQCVTARPHRASPTSRYGRAARHGLSTATQCATATPKILVTLPRLSAHSIS